MDCTNCGRSRPAWAMYNASANQLPNVVANQIGVICGDCIEQLERCGHLTGSEVEALANDAVE